MERATRAARFGLSLGFGLGAALLAAGTPARAAAPTAAVPAAKEKLEYNRDVRPILADACFRCHGFDKNTRAADLRLDLREAATAKRDDGPAVVPGKSAESLLHLRIHSKDPEEAMPPKDAPRQLSAKERAILDRWIDEGAEYQDHWAYIPAVRPAPPAVEEPGFSHNAIDRFVLARQRAIGFAHVGPADKATLCRRLHLDLVGLPPTPAEVDAFVADDAPDAYEKLVDKLLASEAFGERMAVWWLDLVRFADTIGYHSDNARNVWPYRDYVIRSFNQNKRFDRFTREQIAGDLLPDANLETRVASAYNRLLLTTEEGGAQAKQYEAKHVTDRVKSIGTTWLAQTFMCCECHDHKYDPVAARDFYALGAFFADIQEGSIGRREEGMLVPRPEDEARMKELEATLAAARKELEAPSPELAAEQAAWEAETAADPSATALWTDLEPAEMRADGELKLALEAKSKAVVRATGNAAPAGAVLTLVYPTLAKRTTGFRLDALSDPKLPAKGPGRAGNGNFVLSEVRVEVVPPEGDAKPLALAKATATFEQDGFPAVGVIDGKKNEQHNGWAVMGGTGKDQSLYLELAEPLHLPPGAKLRVVLDFHYDATHHFGRFKLAGTTTLGGARVGSEKIPNDVAAALRTAPGERTPEQKERIAKHHRSISARLAPARAKLDAAQKARDAFEKALPRCLTTTATTNYRTVRILPRGDFMNETGEVMLPATPKFLPGAAASTPQKRLNRLDLAEWLVRRDNPLTARVFVNRLWKLYYGIGLSKTLEDMGTQGEFPVHQPLLDWLAVEFQESGWDVKHMVRLMTTSGVYRQASVAPRSARDRDPENRELARASTWRLDAEFVRDNALAASGLLVQRVGGPSVKPYQPAGYWENLNFPAREWENDRGDDQWRRGLYTWWQRSYLHPGMAAFDAPSREECTAERIRSNIPQQALVMLNDPTYVEAARALAARMVKEGGDAPAARIAWGWKRCTSRSPSPEEVQTLVALFERHRAQFEKAPQEAEATQKTGFAPTPADLPKAELAAYTSAARVMLNLHETLTRR